MRETYMRETAGIFVILGAFLGIALGIALGTADVSAQESSPAGSPPASSPVSLPETLSPGSGNLDHRLISPQDFEPSAIRRVIEEAGDQLTDTLRNDLLRLDETALPTPGVPVQAPESQEFQKSQESSLQAGTPEPAEDPSASGKPGKKYDGSLQDIEDLQKAEENLALVAHLTRLVAAAAAARDSSYEANKASLEASMSYLESVLDVRRRKEAVQLSLTSSARVEKSFGPLVENGLRISGEPVGSGVAVLAVPVPMDNFAVDWLGLDETFFDIFRLDISGCQGRQHFGDHCQLVWRWQSGGPLVPINLVFSFRNLDSGLYHRIPIQVVPQERSGAAPYETAGYDPSQDPGYDPEYDPAYDPSQDPAYDPAYNPAYDPAYDPNSSGNSNLAPRPQSPPLPGLPGDAPPVPEEFSGEIPFGEFDEFGGLEEPEIPQLDDFSVPDRTVIRYFRDDGVSLDVATGTRPDPRGGEDIPVWENRIYRPGDPLPEGWEIGAIDPDSYRVELRRIGSLSAERPVAVTRERRFQSLSELVESTDSDSE